MQKRGLSGIITIIILVALVLVASVVVWGVIRNVIQTGSEGVTLEKFMISAEIKDVSIDNSSNNVSVSVKRGTGKGELSAMKFVFSTGVDTEIITANVSIKELEERIFTFHLIRLDVDDLISISIVPVLKIKGGKDLLGNLADVYDVKTGKSVYVPPTGPSCGNNVTEQGEVCDGIDLNGGTCQNQGFAGGGNLSCLGNCLGYDTSQCTSEEEGLIAYYPFNGNTLDESGNGNDGTPYGGVDCDFAGIDGQACSFDGIDDYIDAGTDDSLNFNENFTISAWFNASTDLVTGIHIIVGRADTNYYLDNGEKGYYLLLREVSGTDRLYFNIGGATIHTQRSLEVGNLDAEWHHIVGVKDGNTYNLYFDGVLVNTFTIDLGDMSVPGANLYIGKNLVGGYFNGLMDEVRIYDKALNQGEIDDLYGGVSCTPVSNPCGSWVCGDVQNGTCGQVSCGTCTGPGESCDGSGNCVVQTAQIINATGCTLVEVETAIGLASDGDTVMVPACPSGVTWNSAITIDKEVVVIGAGIGSTIITDYGFAVSDGTDNWRITGIEWTNNIVSGLAAPVKVSGSHSTNGCHNFRIDNCKFEGYDYPLWIGGHSAGVIDHNNFVGGINLAHGILIWGSQHDAWARDISWGSSDFVFIEDNIFNNDGVHIKHIVVSGHGAQWVFRHNTITESGNHIDGWLDMHGFCHGASMRGARAAEIYNNMFTRGHTLFARAINIRGGTALIYDNTFDETIDTFNQIIQLTDYRAAKYVESIADDCGVPISNEVCPSADGGEGYPCTDQPGRGKDQGDEPIYSWNNVDHNSNPVNIVVDPNVVDYIQLNRDYYESELSGYEPYDYPHPLTT